MSDIESNFEIKQQWIISKHFNMRSDILETFIIMQQRSFRLSQKSILTHKI